MSDLHQLITTTPIQDPYALKLKSLLTTRAQDAANISSITHSLVAAADAAHAAKAEEKEQIAVQYAVLAENPVQPESPLPLVYDWDALHPASSILVDADAALTPPLPRITSLRPPSRSTYMETTAAAAKRARSNSAKLPASGLVTPAHTARPRSQTNTTPVPGQWRNLMGAHEIEREKKVLRRMKERTTFLRNPRYVKSLESPLFKKNTTNKWLAQNVGSRLELLPAVVTFDTYHVGDVTTQTLKLRNVTNVMASLRLLPPPSPHFAISTGTWPSASGSIAPGMTCTFTVAFKPDSLRDYDDELVVVTDHGEEIRVPLQGRRTPPQLSLPPCIDLGHVLVGSCATQSFVVSNSGGPGTFRILSQHDAQTRIQDDGYLDPDLFAPGANKESPNEKEPGGKEHAAPPFSVFPTSFSLGSGETMELQITFFPQENASFSRELHIACDNLTLSHHEVVGTGVFPILELEAVDGEPAHVGHDDDPQDSSEPGARPPVAHVEFEAQCPNASTTRTLTFANLALVPLTYEFVLYSRSKVVSDMSHLEDIQPPASVSPESARAGYELTPTPLGPIFDVFPAQGVVASAETAHQVTVSFTPPATGSFDGVLALILKDAQPEEEHSDDDHDDAHHYSGAMHDLVCLHVVVEGTGIPVQIEAAPALIAFPGDLTLGTKYTKQVQLVNHSPSPVAYLLKSAHAPPNVNAPNGKLPNGLLRMRPEGTDGEDVDGEDADADGDDNVSTTDVSTFSSDDEDSHLRSMARLRSAQTRPRTARMKLTPREGTIPAHSTIVVDVVVRSRVPGPFVADLLCQVEGGTRVPLRVHASFAPVELKLTVAALDFGFVPVGSIVETEFGIYNPSGSSASFSVAPIPTSGLLPEAMAAGLTGLEVGAFALSPPSGSVNPERETQVRVRFQPSQEGTFHGLLQIDVSAGKTMYLAVTAEVQAPVLHAMSSQLQFGDMFLGVEKVATVQLVNPTLLEVAYSGSTLGGWGGSVRVEPSQGVLPPRSTQNVQVTLEPGKLGPVSDAYVVFDVAGMSAPLGVEASGSVSGASVQLQAKDIESGSLVGDSYTIGTDPEGVALCLDFGPSCKVLESATAALVITNQTGIPSPFSVGLEHLQVVTGPHPDGFTPGGHGTAGVGEGSDGGQSSGRSGSTSATSSSKMTSLDLSKVSSSLSKNSVLTLGGDNVVGRTRYLADDYQETHRLMSLDGQDMLHTKRRSRALMAERQTFLSDGTGVAFAIHPAGGVLGPYESVTLVVVAYNEMPGVYRDALVVEVEGLAPAFVPVAYTVEGDVVTLEANTLGLTPGGDGRDPSVLFGTALVGGDSVHRAVKYANSSPFDIQLDWSVYNRKRNATLVDVDLTVDGDGVIDVSVAEHLEEADGPFRITPSSAIIPGHGTGTFGVSFTGEAESLCHSFLLGHSELVDPSKLPPGATTLPHGLQDDVRLELVARGVVPSLMADVDELRFVWSYGSPGPKPVKRVVLSNTLAAKVEFRLGIQPDAPFSIVGVQPSIPKAHNKVTDIWTLPAGTNAVVSIEFGGTDGGASEAVEAEVDTTVIESALQVEFTTGARQETQLAGRIVYPRVMLSTSMLDLGLIFVSQTGKAKFTITNPSVADAAWSLSVIESSGPDSGSLSFSPESGLLPGKVGVSRPSEEDVEVSLVFDAGVEEGQAWAAVVEVQAGSSVCRMAIRGVATWEESMDREREMGRFG